MRNLLPLAPFVAVIPLGEALATHSYAAVPLAALVFAGLVAMTSRTVPHAASTPVLRFGVGFPCLPRGGRGRS